MTSRVAYIADLEEGPESGVGKKIINQAVALLTGEVSSCTLFICSIEGKNTAAWEAVSQSGLVVKVLHYRKSLLARHVLTFWLLYELLKLRPAIVYSRQLYFYLGLYLCVRLFPFVFEINTDDLAQVAGKRMVYLYHKWTRGFYLSRAAGIVFVSQHMHDLPSFDAFTCPKVVIGNGHDASKVDWSGLKAGDPALDARFAMFTRNVFFIGTSEQPWQGVDKVIEMASLLPAVGFHLVGRIDVAASLPPNVFLYGFIPLSQYQYVIARCDVAISSLAMHRKSMQGNSALKAAEYVMFKKPVILAYKEDDFPEAADYLLRLPNEEDNVRLHCQVIADFIERSPTLTVPDTLVAKMAMSNKNRQRAEFLARLSHTARTTEKV